METRNKKRIGPLPGGERRGASGADAGCLSMRSIGGRELSRRVPTDKNVTADPKYRPTDLTDSSSSRSLTPAEDVSQEALVNKPATTKAGKPRVRMQWTEEMNLFIMRTYLYITRLETDNTMYCKKLHDNFISKYPNINVSSQRIADQRRVIVRNKLLSDEVIKTLKKEISDLLSNEENGDSLQQSIKTHTSSNKSTALLSQESLEPSPLVCTIQLSATQFSAIPSSHASTQTNTSLTLQLEHEQNQEQSPYKTQLNINKLTNDLETALIQYTGIDPTARPKLPKLKENKRLYEYLDIFNKQILKQFYFIDSDLNHIHTLIYCSALVIAENSGYHIRHSHSNLPTTKRKPQKPAWQIRLELDIKKLRADIGKLTQYINGNRSPKLLKKVQDIFKRLSVHSIHESKNSRPEEFLDTLKQKLSLKSQRLARYNKALRRKIDNDLFHNSEKVFYRNLNKKQDTINSEIPEKEALLNYWTDLWKKKESHNEEAEWLSDVENRWKDVSDMEFVNFTREDIEKVVRHVKNWKAAGIDGIHNFWYKKFYALHDILANIITDIVNNKQVLPKFVTKGITYMLPKNSDTMNPSQYRPITCLPTIYKLITACITHKINKHLIENSILAEEQKGCRQNHKGCKEQLIIDSIVLKHANTHKKNLHISYIDYKKAFDSVPHSWLVKILKIYKIHPSIVKFLQNAMAEWRTTLHLSVGNNKIMTEEIYIENGIFQGDSLSPLWFCLALNPLSHLLNSMSSCGYKLNNDTAITHLMYMDDIKIFAKTKKGLQILLKITTQFSQDINMSFGIDKCKTIHINRGKIDSKINNEENISFNLMESGDTYKYLGVHQSNSINHIQIKKHLIMEFTKRVNAICKRQLHSKNLFKAINAYAIPVLTYTFGVIKWTQTDIKRLQIKTRTTLTKFNYLHPKSAIERINIKRIKGGRGLIDLEVL